MKNLVFFRDAVIGLAFYTIGFLWFTSSWFSLHALLALFMVLWGLLVFAKLNTSPYSSLSPSEVLRIYFQNSADVKMREKLIHKWGRLTIILWIISGLSIASVLFPVYGFEPNQNSLFVPLLVSLTAIAAGVKSLVMLLSRDVRGVFK